MEALSIERPAFYGQQWEGVETEKSKNRRETVKSLFLIIGGLNIYLFSHGSLAADLKERHVASQGFSYTDFPRI